MESSYSYSPSSDPLISNAATAAGRGPTPDPRSSAVALATMRRRFWRLHELTSVVAVILCGVSLAVNWWTLSLYEVGSGGSAGASLGVTRGSVYTTSICDVAQPSGIQTCHDVTAWNDQEATLRVGQLTAGAILIAGVIGGVLNAGRAYRWSNGSSRGPDCAGCVRTDLWIALRGLWLTAIVSMATATFCTQVVAWKAEYIDGLPIVATLVWGPGMALACAAAVVYGLGAVAAFAAKHRADRRAEAEAAAILPVQYQ